MMLSIFSFTDFRKVSMSRTINGIQLRTPLHSINEKEAMQALAEFQQSNDWLEGFTVRTSSIN